MEKSHIRSVQLMLHHGSLCGLSILGPVTLSHCPVSSTVAEHQLQVYDVLAATCNETFPHYVPVALFGHVIFVLRLQPYYLPTVYIR